MKEFRIKGLRIACRYRGKGEPLVLLHGALSDSRSWERQLNALSDDFMVVAWDAPGCGRSSDPPEGFRLKDYADCLAELIDEMKLNRPHILGLSFGGGLALEFYRRHPEIPKSLILASAYAGWAGSLPAETVQYRFEKGLQQSYLTPEKVVEAWMPTLFNESVPLDVIRETEDIMLDFHPKGMRVMLKAFAEADLRDVLPDIRVPTLLLYGDADQRYPLPVARKLHEKIPASTLVIMKGVGHVVHTESPDQFNSEVRSFLESIRN
jgi:pimeloyl-ACP methyl ester carboxylesterase